MYEISENKKIIKFMNGKDTIEYVAGGKHVKIHEGNITKCKYLSNLTPQQLQYCSNLSDETASDIIEVLRSNACFYESCAYEDFTKKWLN